MMQISAIQLSAQFYDYPYQVLDSFNLSITYSIAWKEDTNNLERVRSEKMILMVGKEVSKFMSKNFYEYSNMGREAERAGLLQEFFDRNERQNYRTRFSYQILKNYPKGSYTYYNKVLPDFFQYAEPLQVFQWELLDETDSIGNYPVQKAHCTYGGREWVAWYTSSVPINDGPYKFRGLPGLIIKIHDEKEHYVFILDVIERYDKYFDIEFEDMGWVTTTRENYLMAEQNFRLDIISRAKEAGATAVSMQRAYRSMLKKNNPIEF
ncbi:MAG: GLPGLI family protein [Sphaerochaetaceae bacterium]